MTLAAAARAGVATTTLVLITGCTSTTDEDPDAAQTSPTASAEPSAAASAVLPAVRTGLGSFPAFPTGRLPVSVAASLQAVLDQAVADDIVRGATASVIVAGSGSWAGAAGVGRQGGALRVDSRLLTASVGKTVTAAQILRLVDDGKLTLDDRASDYFPARLSAFDANDATVRDLLGMRSGLADPDNYGTLVARGLTTPDLMARADPPFASAGSTIQYANLNFLMLGEIIEQVAGRPLAQVMRAGVLAHPDLGGLSHDGAKNAMAADGWHMRTDPATLARWGNELYGRRRRQPRAARRDDRLRRRVVRPGSHRLHEPRRRHLRHPGDRARRGRGVQLGQAGRLPPYRPRHLGPGQRGRLQRGRLRVDAAAAGCATVVGIASGREGNGRSVALGVKQCRFSWGKPVV